MKYPLLLSLGQKMLYSTGLHRGSSARLNPELPTAVTSVMVLDFPSFLWLSASPSLLSLVITWEAYKPWSQTLLPWEPRPRGWLTASPSSTAPSSVGTVELGRMIGVSGITRGMLLILWYSQFLRPLNSDISSCFPFIIKPLNDVSSFQSTHLSPKELKAPYFLW